MHAQPPAAVNADEKRRPERRDQCFMDVPVGDLVFPGSRLRLAGLPCHVGPWPLHVPRVMTISVLADADATRSLQPETKTDLPV